MKDRGVIVGPMPWNKPNQYIPIPIPFPMGGKIKRQKVRVVAAGSTYSYVTLFSPRRISKTKEARALNRYSPTNSAEYFVTQRSQCGCGQQTSFTYSWLTNAAYDSMLAGSPTASAPKTSDLWFRRGTLSLLMTNNTNANIFCEIWEGYYRRTVNSHAGELWQQGLKDQGLTGPTGLTNNPECLYNMDPLKSRLFTQFCRVTNVTSVELGEGRCHKHVSRLYGNHKYNNELYQQYGATYSKLSGMTRWMTVIFRGSPINEKGPTNVGTVSTSVVGIDMVLTTKYSYFYNTPNQTSCYTSGTFPVIGTPVTMNEATGASVDNVAV